MRHLSFALLAAASSLVATPALAAGDLLVAPTRVLLDGARGTEVILNNVGAAPATYRITLELRRMGPDGKLNDVAPETMTEREKATLAMISYAPRRVTLPPNQPQVVRVGARFPEGLNDGEYRAHLLFRAIPDAAPAVPQGTSRPGLSIALTPIYGVSIPVIVRKGSLDAAATISDLHLERKDGQAALAFRMTRTGTRSVYGRIRVTKVGVAKPVYEARGLAVYAELGERSVTLPLAPEVAAAMVGPVTLDYLEDNDAGGLIARAQGVLR